MTDLNETTYSLTLGSPLKTLFKESSKGTKEEFMVWMIDRYPEFICLLLRTSIYADNIKCRR